MKLKKLLAGAMAAVLTLGSVTVLAASEGSLGGDTSGTGKGEFEGYVVEEKLAYTLPTIASTGGFDFILDPQGLVATASGQATTFASASSYTTGSMYFKNVSGSTYSYSQKSDAMTITNNGSVDIDITVNAVITPNSTLASGASVAFTTGSSFADNAGASVYLALTDNTNTLPIATVSGSSYKAQMTAEVKGSPEAYGIVATGDSYEYKQTVADYASFASYSFYLTGASGGDWSKLASNNGQKIFDISVVWDVKKHIDETISLDATTAALKVAETKTLVPTVVPTGTTVTWKSSDASVATVSNGVVTAVAAGTATITAETPTGQKATCVVTVTVADAKPSIANTTYKMTSGKAIEVAVNLGSGNLAATNISSITYKNSSGLDKTLDTANYTFENGKLTFTSAYVDSVLSAGVTSRAYTITFNDNAGTSIPVTLSTN